MLTLSCTLWLLLLSQLASCRHAPLSALPTITPTPRFLTLPRRNETELAKRAITTELSTCGYLNGDSDLIRTADPGYDCRVDTKNGLWGFCPNTVISATDCGLAGSCFDKRACSKGCGKTDSQDLTTFTCTGTTYCSTALLTFGVDQTYSYIACGAKSGTDHYQITPIDETTTATVSSAESTESKTSSTTFQGSTATSENTSNPTTSNTKSETAQTTADSDESATETTSAASTSSSSGSPTNIGAIIGGVLGGLALICGTTIAVFYILRRNNRRESSQPPERDGVNQAPVSSFRDEPKPPQELTSWTPHELPGSTHYGDGRGHAVELSS